ncbi:hypothetical protein J31TS6_38770 [Brevibacillus reuszeri]|nr:hypothetical protein J31TS6_38770 [Brevibacillus reuszeri]
MPGFVMMKPRGGPKKQGRQPAFVLEAIEVDELVISFWQWTDMYV